MDMPTTMTRPMPIDRCRLAGLWLMLLLSLLAGCDKPPADGKDVPTLVYTHYTAETELFVEFPALVVGQGSRLLAHFTLLADHTPVSEGRVDVLLQQSGRTVAGFRVSAPTRDGLFTPVVTPREPGNYQLLVKLNAQGLDSTHALGEVTVFASAGEVDVDRPEPEGEISFLKERQWQGGFASVPVTQQPLRPSVPGIATVLAPADGGAQIPAPGDGYFSGSDLVRAGTVVNAGDVLGYLVPRLGAGEDLGDSMVDYQRARSTVQLARNDVDRLTGLLARGAISERRLQEAQQALRVAEAQWQAAQARLQQSESGTGASGIALRAPVAGEVVEVRAQPGGFVRAGEQVFRIATPERRWLQVQVPERYANDLQQASGVWFDHPAGGTRVLDGRVGAHRVQVAAAVDERTRTASVTFEYPREAGPGLIGNRFAAYVFTRPPEPRLAIPRSALVEDAGRPVVFVHSSGETFARREVQTGLVDGHRVEVLAGLSAGERVVSDGAWSVRLAASGGDEIGHGHAH